MLIEILSDSFGDFPRSRGGTFESNVGTKGLIVYLAALEGKIDHTGRDHVRRVFEGLAKEIQHQSGCSGVVRGQLVDFESKSGHFDKGEFLAYLSNLSMY